MKVDPWLHPALRYLSEAWAEEALARVEDDERVLAATRGLDVGLLTIILRPPPGTYGFMYVAFDGGGLCDYRVGHDYAAVAKGIAPTFVVSGTYDVFASVQRGDLSERKAILTGRLHLTGSVLKALRYMGTLEAISAVLREIDCET